MDSVKLKLNGTFKRQLYLLDKNNCLYSVEYRVQTALWFNDKTSKWQYVSIFPSFIKKYIQPCINLLEYISCKTRKGENIFEHIDDPKEILDCEDRIVNIIKGIENNCNEFNYTALLNSKYTQVYNTPLIIETKSLSQKLFGTLYMLVITARAFSGKQEGVLALINSLIAI
ncbi:hypothetical protein RBH29_17720 [Herbivorax sp. ANBcel31]|uniref:hypothetical protein n=1 Tax=Herbivorax sp. ANBcel31 TaxID=3069754 RepID=UPI0027AF71BB|nr:hypothetical protein [Herbivorax sp. ANBcel31]MDQ2088266.1 hypothetical protein [Herbivorax sp. ANBcel31]